MVLERLVVDLLNHFLGPYVKNLDPSQLKVAIWSGNVLLENLELKENVMDDFNIPIRIFRGYLEQLRLKIPWKNIYSAPIIVEVDGLYAIAGPSTALKYSKEREEKEKKEWKEKVLKRIEEARKKAEEPKDGKAAQDPGFVEKLIAQVIRNVQVTVKNIHIRYEDAVTSPSHPFCFGITLDSLHIQSTDSGYVVGNQSADKSSLPVLIFKLLKLSCLALYWRSNAELLGTSPPDNWMELLNKEIARPNSALCDMHYIVHPISLEAKLQLSTRPGREMDIPQALVAVSLRQIALALERNQFRDVMSLIESLYRMTTNLKYLKYRPDVGVCEGVRVWWRYAVTAVREEEVKRKLEMWSWKHMKQHRQWCRQYVEAYSLKQLSKSATPALKEELEELEMRLDLFNLTICRQLADNKVRLKRRVKEEQQRGEGGWWGWAGSWLGSGPQETGTEVASAIPTEEELKEERKKLYEAIGYSEATAVATYPKEYVAHDVGLQLDNVSVQLRNDQGIVAHVSAQSVDVHIQNRPASKGLRVAGSLGRLAAYGQGGEDEEEREEGEGEREERKGPVIIDSRHDKDVSLLSFSLEFNPVDDKVDQKLHVLLLPVLVTYHADTIDAVVAMFLVVHDVKIHRLSAAAASTLEELKTQGRAGLEHAIGQRKLLDLDIVINSPCLVVPQNGVTTSSSSVVVVDFGRLEIKSDLKSVIPDVRSATKEQLEEAFYDHFDLALHRLQVLVAGPGELWQEAWSASSSPLHLLEPTFLELQLKKSLLPNDTRLPNLKVRGELPNFSLNLSDRKIKQMLELVQSLPLPPPSLAQKRLKPAPSYSSSNELAMMDTDDIMESLSESLLIQGNEEDESDDDDDEYETASECEEDEEGIFYHRPPRGGGKGGDGGGGDGGGEVIAVASTIKLSLEFAVNKIAIFFNEYKASLGQDRPRLLLLVTSVTSQVLLRSWDFLLTASVGDLLIADHYICGKDRGVGTMLSTVLADGDKFLSFRYSKFDPAAPQYSTVFQSTRQSLSASLSLLTLQLHRESLLNLLDIGRSISAVLKPKSTEPAVVEELPATTPSQPEDGDSTPPPPPPPPPLPSPPPQLPGERELHLTARLVGVEVVMSGGDEGEVISASVEGLETILDIFHDRMEVKASMRDISVVDRERGEVGEKFIHRVNEEKEIVSLNLVLFKPPPPRPPSASITSCDLTSHDLQSHDLESCDLYLQAKVERLRITLLFRFLGRVKTFGTRFLNQLKLDQTTIDSAKETASQTASKTAEALKEKSSSRVRLKVIIFAPLLVVPYYRSLSHSPSYPSPSFTSSPTPLGAIVANLGILTVQNKFRLASESNANGREPKSSPSTPLCPSPSSSSSPYLSPSGVPAIVDCMDITISSVQLSRVLDHKWSGDFVSHDTHVILEPLQFSGQVTRSLSGWCTAIPAVSVVSKLEAVQMKFSPVDYHAVIVVLQEVKEMDVKKEKEGGREGEEEAAKERVSKTLSTEGTDGKKAERTAEDAKKEGVEEGGEEVSSLGGDVSPSVHVEAVVGGLELVLHSKGQSVAELRVNKVVATVDMFDSVISIEAGVSTVEVVDCSQVVYEKIISMDQGTDAVSAQVVLYSTATQGPGYFNPEKCDLTVALSVQRIRVVALHLFVSRIVCYLKELRPLESNDSLDRIIPTDQVISVEKITSEEPSLIEPSPQQERQKRIKLSVSVQAPEITVPLNSESLEIVVLNLGQLTLTNMFHVLDTGFAAEQNRALYEEYLINLTDLEVYRSIWDPQGNKPTVCQRNLLQPFTLDLEMERNLSASWYHGMPAVSMNAKLKPLQVVASGDDIESLCSIVAGNLRESVADDETFVEKSSNQFSDGGPGPSKQEPVAEAKRSDKSAQKEEVEFTTVLASAELTSIGIKLYRTGHALNSQNVSTWERDEKRELTGLVLKNFHTSVSIENTGAMSGKLTMGEWLLDDLRPAMDEEEEEMEEEEEVDGSDVDVVDISKKIYKQRISRLIQRREALTLSSPQISVEYSRFKDNNTKVTVLVDGIQALTNLKYIQILAAFIQESTRPLTQSAQILDEDEVEENLMPDAATTKSKPVKPVLHDDQAARSEPSRIQVVAKVQNSLIALLEDGRDMNSAALVLQAELQADLSLKFPAHQTSLHSSIMGLTISTARYPNLDRRISKNVLEPHPEGILAYVDQWDTTTNVEITVPSLTFVFSPAVVRLILKAVRSLNLHKAEEEKIGETAPVDLWTSKPLTERALRRKWYLKKRAWQGAGLAEGSSVDKVVAMANSHKLRKTQRQQEYLSMLVANITVLIEQEVTTPTLRTFPAISISMGKYAKKALAIQLNNWSSQLTATAVLSLEISYYNIRNDSWEPVLEPVLNPNNENRYISWSIEADVKMTAPKGAAGGGREGGERGEGEDEEEEEEGSAGLSVTVFAKSALQLTVTKTSLSIFNALWKDYTESRISEEVDVPETLNASFAIVSKLGKDYPVVVKPHQSLKVHGAYSPVVRDGDNPLPLHSLEGAVEMGPGELLPRDSHLRRVHIVQLQIPSFAPLDIALGMYERVYYPLSPQQPGADSSVRIGIVVDIDRTAGTPIVTLRSPLRLHNLLNEAVAVYYSTLHSPPLATASVAAHVLPGATLPLPLNTTGEGYFYFKLGSTKMSQQPVSWRSAKSMDLSCPLSSEGESHEEATFFIHSHLEEEIYSRTPSFPLTNRPHHTIHLHHPLIINNLLPHPIVVSTEHHLSRIKSGCEAPFTDISMASRHRLKVKVEDGGVKWSGKFVTGHKVEPETNFKVVSHDSYKLLTVKTKEKGTWHLTVFSKHWLVNKTGLTLEYKAGESFFVQKSDDVFIHSPQTAIVLFSYEEVHVRVVRDGMRTEWSDKFSLVTVGSEGIFSCSFKDRKEVFQIGSKVEMSKFGISKIITLSPFYILNNETRDVISVREWRLRGSEICAVPAQEVTPFWPRGSSEKLIVSVADAGMSSYSVPFTYTETCSFFIRTGGGRHTSPPSSPSSSPLSPSLSPSPLSSQPPAVEVEVQVTGSANIITFTAYYPGCVPLQLVNHTHQHLYFMQNSRTLQRTYSLGPYHSLMYTWDDPHANKELMWGFSPQQKKLKISPQDSSGSVLFSGGSSSLVDLYLPPSPLLDRGVEETDVGREEGEKGADGEMRRSLKFSEEERKRQVQSGGVDEADFDLRRTFSRISMGVGKFKAKVKKRSRDTQCCYWISFMDGLQQVVLFTTSDELKSRVEQGTKEIPHTELSLSLIGISLSLVDDVKGQEISFIGISQSQKEWQIRVKKLWKAIPPELNEAIEAAYHDSAMKTKGKKRLPNSNHDIDFVKMYLYDCKGNKNKLKRSHFEGVAVQVTASKHLTTFNIRVSHIQVDNQLPFTVNPIIFYPYPPSPTVASKFAPKPFVESTIIMRKTEQSNVNQLEFLQVLVQEVGVSVDMTYLMAMMGLLCYISDSSTEAQMVEEDVKLAKLPLKESKVAAVSATTSRNYFKYMHLSPLHIHLSFSLEVSPTDEEATTEKSVLLTVVFNILTSFASLIGKTKDAELKLGYFELRDVTLTRRALTGRITKHYIQQGAIQMYSIVLGLEVLGNPVGFIKGLKEGTVNLFYHPIQGAVLGPEEFFEGVKLGGMQFVGGTLGGISGVLGRVTGVLGDTTAKLTMDDEFVARRKQGSGGVGQGLEGAAKGMLEGVTGLVSQPIKGAKKEGLWGLVKGTGKGVIGLVLRPTGGLIDLTSATFNAVQKKTKVGEYEVPQLRPPRFIGQPKIVYPYSPHKAAGYALFLEVDRGELVATDIYFDHVELNESPLRILLVTNNQLVVIKYKNFFDRWEEEWKVKFKSMRKQTRTEGPSVIFTVLEEQGVFGGFLGAKKQAQLSTRSLKMTPELAQTASRLVNQAFQEYKATQAPLTL